MPEPGRILWVGEEVGQRSMRRTLVDRRLALRGWAPRERWLLVVVQVVEAVERKKMDSMEWKSFLQMRSALAPPYALARLAPL